MRYEDEMLILLCQQLNHLNQCIISYPFLETASLPPLTTDETLQPNSFSLTNAVAATPANATTSDSPSLDTASRTQSLQAASLTNSNRLAETTPISVIQSATPSAPTAVRHRPQEYAPSPAEIAVDLASAILSQLTTTSTAAVTSSAAVATPSGKCNFFVV